MGINKYATAWSHRSRRAEIKGALKHSYTHRKNITKEAKVPKELRRDKYRVILMADKGVPLVVLHKIEYTNKAQELFEDWEDIQKNLNRSSGQI